MKALDVNFVRRKFPALKDDFVFFDNAGGAHINQYVLDNIQEYYLSSNVQLGGIYKHSLLARQRVDACNHFLATMMNAATDEIVVGSSTTSLIHIFASLIAAQLNPGDEIIITDADHEANASPWRILEQHGIVIRNWAFDPETKQLEKEDLIQLLNPKTKLLAFCHVSNIFGTIHDVKAFTQLAHDNGTQVFVDGVAYAPHRSIDVKEWGVDYYVFSLYKVFGPHQAVLYGKKDLLLALGSVNHYFIGREEIPYKFQPGGQNYELSHGITGIKTYFLKLAKHHDIAYQNDRDMIQKVYQLFSDHESILSQKLLGFLKKQANIRIIGSCDYSSDERVSTISFVHANFNAETVIEMLSAHEIGAKSGDFYAKGITRSLSLDEKGGVIRISMVHYNTLDEVDRLINILKDYFNNN